MSNDNPSQPDPSAIESEVPEQGFQHAAAKVREFPQSAGVYLMKDNAGRVIYVGKAKNLRSRAGSYFLKGAEEEWRTADWIHEICDIDYIECESEVDALLMESRLCKDIQPKHNKELKDDKTFPYLMITTREDFPRVEVTREPKDRGVKLFGPFANAGDLRGAVQVLQRISGPVCWLASINAPPPAIYGLAKRITVATFADCKCFWKATSRRC
jgi:excinuclease ABC subunit C